MNPLWWDWKDRDWCPICQACPLVWQADRCSCCKVPWGDPYGAGHSAILIVEKERR